MDPKTMEWQEGFAAGRVSGAVELSERIDVAFTTYYAGECREPRRATREAMRTLLALIKNELSDGFGDDVK